jgi:hypothetical protein
MIKGHGRLQAAKLLGLDEVPVIQRSDLSDAETKASRIADNKTAESAWELDSLGSELEQLADRPEIDIDSVGFDDHELDMFLTTDDTESELPTPPNEDTKDEFQSADDSDTPTGTSEQSKKITDNVNDPAKEWEWVGMPEYINEDKSFNHSIRVRFEDGSALESLSDKLGITLTPKTTSFYWPLTDTDRGEIEYQMLRQA